MKRTQLIWIAGSVALLAVGVFVVPKILKKATAKVYKNSQPELDFDNMGPEIVKKENSEEYNDGN
jgi:hypothetical protein